MTALLITPEKIAEINAAVAKARANVIPWKLMRDFAIYDSEKPTDTLMLSERKPGSVRRPASISVHFDGGVRAAISFEEQPAGITRHFSVSTGKPGNNHLPHPVLIAEFVKLFGFSDTPVRIMLRQHTSEPFLGRIWVEEYRPNFFAVNVIELVVEHTPGHA